MEFVGRIVFLLLYLFMFLPVVRTQDIILPFLKHFFIPYLKALTWPIGIPEFVQRCSYLLQFQYRY